MGHRSYIIHVRKLIGWKMKTVLVMVCTKLNYPYHSIITLGHLSNRMFVSRTPNSNTKMKHF